MNNTPWTELLYAADWAQNYPDFLRWFTPWEVLALYLYGEAHPHFGSDPSRWEQEVLDDALRAGARVRRNCVGAT